MKKRQIEELRRYKQTERKKENFTKQRIQITRNKLQKK